MPSWPAEGYSISVIIFNINTHQRIKCFLFPLSLWGGIAACMNNSEHQWYFLLHNSTNFSQTSISPWLLKNKRYPTHQNRWYFLFLSCKSSLKIWKINNVHDKFQIYVSSPRIPLLCLKWVNFTSSHPNCNYFRCWHNISMIPRNFTRMYSDAEPEKQSDNSFIISINDLTQQCHINQKEK